jgi:hypothetical protein
MTRPAAAPATPARIDRVVVHATGEVATGTRLAERLPSALDAAVRAAGTLDERALRALITETVGKAAR